MLYKYRLENCTFELRSLRVGVNRVKTALSSMDQTIDKSK